MGGGFGGERIHAHIAKPLCCSPETTTALLISYTPIQTKKFKVWKKRQIPQKILNKLDFFVVVFLKRY